MFCNNVVTLPQHSPLTNREHCTVKLRMDLNQGDIGYDTPKQSIKIADIGTGSHDRRVLLLMFG